MATVNVLKRSKFSNTIAAIATVTFSNSYPTGGEAVTPQQFGLNSFDFVLPSASTGYMIEFDHVNNKLKAFSQASSGQAPEVTAGTNLSAITVRLLAMGM